MTSKGTAKPYVKFIGAAATGVTQSCHMVRFQKYCILFDCGLYQEGGDIATNYRVNQDFLKKFRIKDVDYVILSHVHIDHSGLIPALFARGCQAHVYVPVGSKPILKLLWEDSMKIFTQDCQKLNNSGKKASPFYTQEDIDKVLDRCIEVEPLRDYAILSEIRLTYYPANHIIYSQQIMLTLQQGYITKRIGYTGDIGGATPQLFCQARVPLPFCDLLIGENTYNQPKRPNNPYDRMKDLYKIKAVIEDSDRVLIPCFSLGRTQTMLTILYRLWLNGMVPFDIKVYVDSPLSQKICNIWDNTDEWDRVMAWENLHFIGDWNESQALQQDKSKAVIISASGFLNGGRVMEWLKVILPSSKNTILFCGYSGENNLASQIRYGDTYITLDGKSYPNLANIIELVSFSSHASYEELLDYYTRECRYGKIALVHGSSKTKPGFADKLQEILIKMGVSSRVVCTNEDTKINL